VLVSDMLLELSLRLAFKTACQSLLLALLFISLGLQQAPAALLCSLLVARSMLCARGHLQCCQRAAASCCGCAGGLEDWAVRCRCGVGDDDGERMIMCDNW
jgi:hypothetical protein